MSKFLKGIVNIILLCAIVVSAALLVPPLAGVTTAVIDEERMETNLPKGSVTYARTKELSEISKGDSILLENGESVYVYEVEAMDSESGAFTLKDALNAEGDTQEKTLRNKAEKVVLTVPFIGYVAMAMKTTEGLIIIGLGVVFVIILFVLAEIWKDDDSEEELEAEEPDDGEDDDEEENDDDDDRALDRRKRKERKARKKAKRKAEKKAEKKRRRAERRGYDDDDEEPLFPKAKERSHYDEKPVEVEEEAAPEEAQEPVFEEKEAKDDFGDTRELLSAVVQETKAEKTEAAEEAKAEEPVQEEEPAQEEEPVQEEAPAEPEPEVREPIQLAIPVYTAEELLAQAEAAGDSPEVIEDKEAGVTILDYSNIL